jgi:hypothetical protein
MKNIPAFQVRVININIETTKRTFDVRFGVSCNDIKYAALIKKLHLVLRSRVTGAISPLPQYVFMSWCLVKHRDIFTFTFTLSYFAEMENEMS